MFTKGQCSRKDCPYNHNFNVIATDPKPESKSHVAEEEDKNSSNLANAYVPIGEEAPLESDREEDLDYGDAEETGFHSNFSNFADVGYVHSCNLSAASFQVGSFSLDCNIFEILLYFILLPLSITYTSLYVIFSKLFSTLLFTTSYICTTLISIFTCICWFLTAPLVYIIHIYNIQCRQSANMATHSPFIEKFPIVMDSGCTIAMSGDLSLFDRKTMKKHRARITLGDTTSAMFSTHVGKIHIRGQVIDALYVPPMTQTLLSLGWFLKQGYKVSNDPQGNLELSLPTNTHYISFLLSNNNLFYLKENTHSA